MIVLLFSVTLFVSAGLMFLVQPMFAKFILPLFGSTPAVWNASMLFFQTTLLVGYLYAHESVRRLGVRRQSALHVGLLVVPLLVLPIGVPSDWIPPTESNPVPSPMIPTLAVALGGTLSSRRSKTLRAVAPRGAGWRPCRSSPGTPVWTDDFSNLAGAVESTADGRRRA